MDRAASKDEDGHRRSLERIATRTAFFIAGFGMAAWAPIIPFVQARLQLSEGALGLLILCLGAGSISMMSATGTIAGRYGCRLPIVCACIVFCFTLPGLGVIDDLTILIVFVTLFGAGLGMIDVAMNLQAVLVEDAHGKPMMSGFHSLFSIGAIAGAGLVSFILWAGGSPATATLCAAMTILLLLAFCHRHLLTGSMEGVSSPFFVVPKGPVLLIGGLSFLVFMTEGAMLDWSAVYLATERAFSSSNSGLGYATFAAGMVVGRLCGDRLVQAFGPQLILITGALCAACGLAVIVAVPGWGAALIGFTLVGIGASNLEPIMFSALGRQTAMPRNLAISAVAMLGYTGLLAGPALIGFAAESFSLSFAFSGLALACLVVGATGWMLVR